MTFCLSANAVVTNDTMKEKKICLIQVSENEYVNGHAVTTAGIKSWSQGPGQSGYQVTFYTLNGWAGKVFVATNTKSGLIEAEAFLKSKVEEIEKKCK